MINKFNLMIIIGICVSGILKGRTYPLDSVITNKSIVYLMIIDSLKFEIFSNKTNPKGIVYVNNRIIDSIHINCDGLPVYHNKRLYFNSYSQNKDNKFFYDIWNRTTTTYNFRFDGNNYLINYFENNYSENRIFIVDPQTGANSIFAKFDMFDDSSLQNVFFIKPQSALVEVCMNSDFEICTDLQYFLTTPFESKKITQELFVPYQDEKYYYTQSVTIVFASTDKNRFLVENALITGSGDKSFYRVLDNNLNEIGYTLAMKHITIFGMNIQSGQIEHYFLSSFSDLKDTTERRTTFGYPSKRVRIPYKFNPTLELAMYKAYHNTVLMMKDIRGLGKFELAVLRNLIFAKYNYAFNSEFYQAYFSIYKFYNDSEARKNRVKDVTDKLTEIDKTNIKFIREMENGK